MSAQVDTVRRVYELFNQLPADRVARREHPALTELYLLFDPEIHFIAPPAQPDRGPAGRAGRAQMSEGWDDWFDAWEEQRAQLEEISEQGDRVVALTDDYFRGRDGIEIQLKGGAVYTFRDGLIVRIQAYFDRDALRRELEA